jgi:hypothetical protein
MFQPNRTKIKNPIPTELEQMPMVKRIDLPRTSSVCNDDEQIEKNQRCKRNRIQRRSDTIGIL